MNLPFNIKFIIFDENEAVSDTQEKLRECIIEGKLRDILKEIFNNDINFKFLNRIEASLCSINENKQLRLDMNNKKKYQHSLHFHQQHSGSKEYFTIEELKYISNKINKGLEAFLYYELDDPILYININETL